MIFRNNNKCTLHIALVGCGRWGQYILRDLKSLGAEVTVVCRSKDSIARALTYHADRIISSWEDVPASVDGIVIATHTNNHFQMILNLAPLNKPIFVEKPHALNEIDAKELLNLEGQLFIMDKFRYHNGILQLKAIREKEILGKVLGLKTKSYRWGINHKDIHPLQILMPHELSIIFEIMGYLPSLNSAIIDHWYDDKMQIQVSLQGKIFAHIDICTYEPKPMREVKLICENGIAVLSGIKNNSIELYPASENLNLALVEKEKFVFSVNQPLFEELKCFIEFLQQGSEPKSNVIDGYKQIKLLDQIYQACKLL